MLTNDEVKAYMAKTNMQFSSKEALSHEERHAFLSHLAGVFGEPPHHFAEFLSVPDVHPVAEGYVRSVLEDEGFSGKTLFQSVAEYLGHAVTAVKDVAEDLMTQTAEDQVDDGTVLDKVLDAVENTVVEGIEAVKEAVADASEALSEAGVKVEEFAEQVSEKVEEAAEAAGEKVDEVVEKVEKALDDETPEQAAAADEAVKQIADDEKKGIDEPPTPEGHTMPAF